jgi:CheY-like chemotaxis protein/HPt (histidine-containing phosphotransfer) domain-containing protein
MGLHADAVANGAEAVTALATIPYDLVLMDVQMPVMDGLEATRTIRASSAVRNPGLPIIAMTAHAMTGDREKCLEAGMNDYVSKPVNGNSLSDAIERWLISKKIINKSVKTEIKETPKKKISKLSVWDKEALLNRLMGDEDFLRTIIAGFLEDIPKQIEKLDLFMENDNILGVERQAHTIRGAAANVGGDALKDIAFEIEKAGKAGKLNLARADIEKLKRCFESLNKEIKVFLG